MKVSRWFNKMYAYLFGYFWLECPLCHRMFGGHEFNGATLMTSWTDGKCVCPNCTEAAEERNVKWMKSHPV